MCKEQAALTCISAVICEAFYHCSSNKLFDCDDSERKYYDDCYGTLSGRIRLYLSGTVLRIKSGFPGSTCDC